MARIKKLGEIDWNFTALVEEGPTIVSSREGPIISQLPGRQEPVYMRALATVLASSSPVILDVRGKVLHLSFLLRLDEPVWKDTFGQREMGYFSEHDGGWGCLVDTSDGDLEFPESELTLPRPIRALLERVYWYLRPLLLRYEWDGQERLVFSIDFDENEPHQCHLEITYFANFLESLARKMSKWYRE